MRKILAISCFLGLLAFSHKVQAQGSFGYSYEYTNMMSFGGFGGFGMTQRYSPPAKYDPHIDPALVRAANIADHRAGPHSTLHCWHSVKEALVDAGAVHSCPTTAYACQAGDELVHHHGFVQLHIRDPYRAPIGAVLVYGGHGAGHVELRTAHGFASDYRSSWACRYQLIGVYAKITS